jgi:anti-sigma regulatory factor (Ser/Thr protein kinase)
VVTDRKDNSSSHVLSHEDATPNPAKLIRNLRGSAYDLNSAVADLVDNSLDAGASEININIDVQGQEISIIDNGFGMNEETHRESMRLGAETREYSSDDLAKFGTGMKAASLSLGGQLTVVTKTKNSKAITVRQLDEEHVIATNDWKVATLVLESAAVGERIKSYLFTSGHGTAITISKLDKAFGAGQAISPELVLSHIEDLESHLRLVFHRFLDGSFGSQRVTIRLNGNPLHPWDPFCLSPSLPLRSKTEEFAAKQLDLGNDRKIWIRGFVLPNKKDFVNERDHKLAAGKKGWNESQGFYIYRNGRLIRWGGWLRTRSNDEHLKLARLAIDFGPESDELFSVNVAKSKVVFPKAMKSRLDSYVMPVIARAQERYRKSNKVLPPRIDPRPSPVAERKSFRAKDLARIIDSLLASGNEQMTLGQFRAEVSQSHKSLARDIGWE